MQALVLLQSFLSEIKTEENGIKMIIVAVGYYYHFYLICRYFSKFLNECVISVHPTTTTRWVHEYGTLIYQILKRKTLFGI